jgi:hypothetical protein
VPLLLDCEEDRTLRAVLVGMLREAISNSGDAARSVPMLQPGLDRRTIRS